MPDCNKFQLNLFDEIIVDNFAGGGGASTGIELATGRPVTIAINHDPAAIAMHKKNHPYTEHYQESVWNIKPQEVCRGRKVALAWFSPDCKHFSRAKGGKPVSKEIRGLAWVAVRWAATVKPRVIILENVPEFQTWCRIGKNGQPDFSRKGENFHSFVNALKRLGYEVKWRELKACDYGAPTIRKRFFLIARCDGNPIVFPKPTHGEGLKPYRTAAECIDWSIPCNSIFERCKPLAENTMRRIARGLDKFTIKADKPFIIPIGYGEKTGQLPRINDIDKPLCTVVSSCKQYLCTPHISKYYGGVVGTDLAEPLPTITSVDHNSLCSASLIQYHTETSHSEVRGQTISEPVMTIDTSPRYALTAAHIVKYYKGEKNSSSCDSPLHTITTKDRNALIESHLCVLRNNQDCKPLTEPLTTECISAGHFAEIRTKIVQYSGNINLQHWPKVRNLLNRYCGYSLAENEILLLVISNESYYISDIGMRMLEPKELYAAQGFPDDYIIDFDVNGVKYSKSAQIARCGNAVPPPFAEALVRANLPELCDKKYHNMKEIAEDIAI